MPAPITTRSTMLLPLILAGGSFVSERALKFH
jgi:hypothetical protein